MQDRPGEIGLAIDDMCQIEARLEAEQYVDVSESEVCIQQHHIVLAHCEGDGQIRCHVGLSDTAFAAGYRDRPDGSTVQDVLQGSGLR